jgi:hypothetical protein
VLTAAERCSAGPERRYRVCRVHLQHRKLFKCAALRRRVNDYSAVLRQQESAPFKVARCGANSVLANATKDAAQRSSMEVGNRGITSRGRPASIVNTHRHNSFAGTPPNISEFARKGGAQMNGMYSDPKTRLAVLNERTSLKSRARPAVLSLPGRTAPHCLPFSEAIRTRQQFHPLTGLRWTIRCFEPALAILPGQFHSSR